MVNYHQYLTFLYVLKYAHLENFSYDCVDGKLNNSFIFLLRGHAKYITAQRTYVLEPGEMIYIPKHQKYTSVYEGDGDVSYMNVVCAFSPDFPTARSAVRIPEMQKLRFTDFCTADEVEELYRSFRDPRKSGTDTICRFYDLYARIEGKMTYRHASVKYNPLRPAVEYMEHHPQENYAVGQLAEMCCMSETYFYRLFREYVGSTPVEYKNRLRVLKAMVLLMSTDDSVAALAAELGFASDDYFTRTFRRFTGLSPTRFRAMQRREEEKEQK